MTYQPIHITPDGRSEQEVRSKIAGLKPDERFLFFSNGKLSYLDVFFLLLEQARHEIETIEVILATWQIGNRNLEAIAQIANDPKINLKILLDASYRSRCKQPYKILEGLFGDKVWLTKNHSKTVAIRSGGYSCVVFASANFNKNFRLEVFDITRSQELYDLAVRNYAPFFETDPISMGREDENSVGRDFKTFFGDEAIEYDEIDLDSDLSLDFTF